MGERRGERLALEDVHFESRLCLLLVEMVMFQAIKKDEAWRRVRVAWELLERQ